MQAGSQGAQVRGTEFSGPVAAGGRFEDTPAALLPSPMLNEPVIHTNVRRTPLGLRHGSSITGEEILLRRPRNSSRTGEDS